MLSCLCSLSHFILTPPCVCTSWCVRLRQIALPSPPPTPVAVQYCVLVIMIGSVLPVFLPAGHIHKRVPLRPAGNCVCLCVSSPVCVCVYRKHLCVILRTSFLAMHADCTSYWARVQPITVHIGALALCLSDAVSLPSTSLFFHLCFRFPISPPRMTFLLSSDNFCALQLLDFTRGDSPFLLLQIEAAALQKTTVPLRQIWVTRKVNEKKLTGELYPV